MAPTEPPCLSAVDRGRVSFAGLDADRTVVWLRGEHDIATVSALSETLARAIALDDADLVVDLSGVEFMSAATLSVLVRAHDFLRLRSRSLTLRSPSPSARRVIDLCGLHEHLEDSTVGPSRVPGSVGALGTWVAVPSADRARPAKVRQTSSAAAAPMVERIPATSSEGP